MNEWIKKITESIKGFWSKWSIVQKAIVGGIVLAVIVAVIFMLNISSAPSAVPIFNIAIKDESLRDNMVVRLAEDNIEATTNADGKLTVKDDKTCRIGQRRISTITKSGKTQWKDSSKSK